MKLHQIREHIYYSDCDHSTDRPTLGYLRGESRCVMIDAGNSARHAQDFLAALAKAQLPQPQSCIITHWHWDHTFGMHALTAQTFAHHLTDLELRRMAHWQWNDHAMQQRLSCGEDIEFADQHIRAEYPDLSAIQVTAADCTFTDQLTIDCGGITCRCLHLPSAHSDDSVVVHIPEEKVLFIGDIYNDDFYHDHFRDLNKTRQLHQALAELDFETAVPGHSAPLSREQLLHFLRQFAL